MHIGALVNLRHAQINKDNVAPQSKLKLHRAVSELLSFNNFIGAAELESDQPHASPICTRFQEVVGLNDDTSHRDSQF